MPADTLLFLPGASGNTDFWKPVANGLQHRGQRRFLASASNGSSFGVAATADSGLPVAITTTGGCSGGRRRLGDDHDDERHDRLRRALQPGRQR
jgi:hypothetical protein